MVTSTNRRQPGLVIPRLSNFVVFIKLAHFHNRSETYHGPNVYTRVFLRSDILYVSGISSIYSFEMISRDHIIQYTPFSQYYIDLVLIQSLGRISDTNPRLENIWVCSSNDANIHNVEICKQTKSDKTV